MRIPQSLLALLDDGIVEEVIRPLQSGKEAQVYAVISEGQTRVAKIYKALDSRNFKNRADYTEGRKVRNSRDRRAMAKRTNYGRSEDEAAWRSTEVDMIFRLRQAQVTVPEPFHFIDGVLIMEMVQGADGQPAARLGEMQFTKPDAHALLQRLLGEVQKMLCAGVVHGDLSDFNILMGEQGPVIIDFPQAIHAADNRNAQKLLYRDVENLYRFVRRFDAQFKTPRFAEEMWHLYESGSLTGDTVLTGRFKHAPGRVEVGEVSSLIGEAREDAVLDAQRRNRPSPPGAALPGAPQQAGRGPSPPQSPAGPRRKKRWRR